MDHGDCLTYCNVSKMPEVSEMGASFVLLRGMECEGCGVFDSLYDGDPMHETAGLSGILGLWIPPALHCRDD